METLEQKHTMPDCSYYGRLDDTKPKEPLSEHLLNEHIQGVIQKQFARILPSCIDEIKRSYGEKIKVLKANLKTLKEKVIVLDKKLSKEKETPKKKPKD